MMGLSIGKENNKPSMSASLRHNEYYDMQDTFDWLYDRSKKKATKGLRLYEHHNIQREHITCIQKYKGKLGMSKTMWN